MKGVKNYNVNNRNKFVSPSRFNSNRKSESGVYRTPLTTRNEPNVINTVEDDEWKDVREPVTINQIEPDEPRVVAAQPLPSGANANGANLNEELEMLLSLKRSLGILSAQATNIKQRSSMLYRESRKRRLYFFDMLLSKTYK